MILNIHHVCYIYIIYIYGNIDHQYTPNVSIYTIHGSVMGKELGYTILLVLSILHGKLKTHGA